MSQLTLQLFISGHSVRSDVAIENLRSTLEEVVGGDFDLTVVDVLEDPQSAEDNLILATPTLIKLAPAPERRTIGDLSDRQSLLRGLDVYPHKKNMRTQHDSGQQ